MFAVFAGGKTRGKKGEGETRGEGRGITRGR